MNRRQFLRTGAASLAALSLNLHRVQAQMRGGGGGGMGGGGMSGGGMGGTGTTIIDPPVGGPFVDPSELPLEPGIIFDEMMQMDRPLLTGYVDAAIAPVNVNGVVADLHTYNGEFPGPNIRVRRGDVLRLNFRNLLPGTTDRNMLGFEKNHTNIHVHGLHVSPLEPADAAHLDIAPEGRAGDYVVHYPYQYDLKHMYPGCLNIYHPHSHGTVAEQYWAGMVGTILLEDDVPGLDAFEEHIMVIKDISLSGNVPTPHSAQMDYMHGKEGNLILVNGVVNPQLTFKAGQVQRWRILNASNARFYKLQLQNHQMYLIGTDGGLLDKPYAVSSILLSPGERVDVLVKATAGRGSYKLLSLPYSRQGNMGSAQITLATCTYSGKWAQALPTVIDPDAARIPVPANLPQQRLALSMGMGRGYINGQDFDVNPYTLMSDVDSYEIWEIVNESGMDHPFHQHIDAAQVLSISGGDAEYARICTQTPAWKDVVVVPKWGSIKLLVPVMDYEGMSMFHCHILEHEDIGMMGMWHRMGMGMGMEM